MEEKIQCYHCGEESLTEEEQEECLCYECQKGIEERLKNFELEQI
jgi:transcription initiation factor TFIIIB Brf1 subunit/transcription initiation factor TFIIB